MEDNTQKIFVIDFDQREHVATYELFEDGFECNYYDHNMYEEVEEVCCEIEEVLTGSYSEVA